MSASIDVIRTCEKERIACTMADDNAEPSKMDGSAEMHTKVEGDKLGQEGSTTSSVSDSELVPTKDPGKKVEVPKEVYTISKIKLESETEIGGISETAIPKFKADKPKDSQPKWVLAGPKKEKSATNVEDSKESVAGVGPTPAQSVPKDKFTTDRIKCERKIDLPMEVSTTTVQHIYTANKVKQEVYAATGQVKQEKPLPSVEAMETTHQVPVFVEKMNLGGQTEDSETESDADSNKLVIENFSEVSDSFERSENESEDGYRAKHMKVLHRSVSSDGAVGMHDDDISAGSKLLNEQNMPQTVITKKIPNEMTPSIKAESVSPKFVSLSVNPTAGESSKEILKRTIFARTAGVPRDSASPVLDNVGKINRNAFDKQEQTSVKSQGISRDRSPTKRSLTPPPPVKRPRLFLEPLRSTPVSLSLPVQMHSPGPANHGLIPGIPFFVARLPLATTKENNLSLSVSMTTGMAVSQPKQELTLGERLKLNTQQGAPLMRLSSSGTPLSAMTCTTSTTASRGTLMVPRSPAGGSSGVAMQAQPNLIRYNLPLHGLQPISPASSDDSNDGDVDIESEGAAVVPQVVSQISPFQDGAEGLATDSLNTVPTEDKEHEILLKVRNGKLEITKTTFPIDMKEKELLQEMARGAMPKSIQQSSINAKKMKDKLLSPDGSMDGALKDEIMMSDLSLEQQIQKFVDEYSLLKVGQEKKEVPVKKLRRFIPLLIMYLYDMKYAEQVRKVKGLWEKKPSDWPERIPFCDPNNAGRGEHAGKPKKETLMLMLYFLINKYNRQIKSMPTLVDSIEETKAPELQQIQQQQQQQHQHQQLQEQQQQQQQQQLQQQQQQHDHHYQPALSQQQPPQLAQMQPPSVIYQVPKQSPIQESGNQPKVSKEKLLKLPVQESKVTMAPTSGSAVSYAFTPTRLDAAGRSFLCVQPRGLMSGGAALVPIVSAPSQLLPAPLGTQLPSQKPCQPPGGLATLAAPQPQLSPLQLPRLASLPASFGSSKPGETGEKLVLTPVVPQKGTAAMYHNIHQRLMQEQALHIASSTSRLPPPSHLPETRSMPPEKSAAHLPQGARDQEDRPTMPSAYQATGDASTGEAERNAVPVAAAVSAASAVASQGLLNLAYNSPVNHPAPASRSSLDGKKPRGLIGQPLLATDENVRRLERPERPQNPPPGEVTMGVKKTEIPVMVEEVDQLDAMSAPAPRAARIQTRRDTSGDSQDGSGKLTAAMEGMLMLSQSKPPKELGAPASSSSSCSPRALPQLHSAPVLTMTSSAPVSATLPQISAAENLTTSAPELSLDSTGSATLGEVQQAPLPLVAHVSDEGSVQTDQAENAQLPDKWDPLQEVMARINHKVELLADAHILSDKNVGLLLLVRDVLKTMLRELKDEDRTYFLEKAHEFECTVDLAMLDRHIPEWHCLKWYEFNGSNGRKFLSILARQNMLPSSIERVMNYCMVDYHQMPALFQQATIELSAEGKDTDEVKLTKDVPDSKVVGDSFHSQNPLIFEIPSHKQTEDLTELLAQLEITPTNFNSALMDIHVLNVELRKQPEVKVPVQESDPSSPAGQQGRSSEQELLGEGEDQSDCMFLKDNSLARDDTQGLRSRADKQEAEKSIWEHLESIKAGDLLKEILLETFRPTRRETMGVKSQKPRIQDSEEIILNLLSEIGLGGESLPNLVQEELLFPLTEPSPLDDLLSITTSVEQIEEDLDMDCGASDLALPIPESSACCKSTTDRKTQHVEDDGDVSIDSIIEQQKYTTGLPPEEYWSELGVSVRSLSDNGQNQQYDTADLISGHRFQDIKVTGGAGPIPCLSLGCDQENDDVDLAYEGLTKFNMEEDGKYSPEFPDFYEMGSCCDSIDISEEDLLNASVGMSWGEEVTKCYKDPQVYHLGKRIATPGGSSNTSTSIWDTSVTEGSVHLPVHQIGENFEQSTNCTEKRSTIPSPLSEHNYVRLPNSKRAERLQAKVAKQRSRRAGERPSAQGQAQHKHDRMSNKHQGTAMADATDHSSQGVLATVQGADKAGCKRHAKITTIQTAKLATMANSSDVHGQAENDAKQIGAMQSTRGTRPITGRETPQAKVQVPKSKTEHAASHTVTTICKEVLRCHTSGEALEGAQDNGALGGDCIERRIAARSSSGHRLKGGHASRASPTTSPRRLLPKIASQPDHSGGSSVAAGAIGALLSNLGYRLGPTLVNGIVSFVGQFNKFKK